MALAAAVALALVRRQVVEAALAAAVREHWHLHREIGVSRLQILLALVELGIHLLVQEMAQPVQATLLCPALLRQELSTLLMVPEGQG